MTPYRKGFNDGFFKGASLTLFVVLFILITYLIIENMIPNQTPTEQEIINYAMRVFPNNQEMQASFIEGAHHTVYYTEIKTK